MLDESGGGPQDVVAFVLSRAWVEVEYGPSKERMDDGLLERGNDAGMNGGVHESIFDGVEVLSEDVVVVREAHVARDHGRCLIHLSGQ